MYKGLRATQTKVYKQDGQNLLSFDGPAGGGEGVYLLVAAL